MEPTIRDLPAMTFVGFTTRFICVHSKDATNHIEIPPLWDRFIERAGGVPGRTSPDTWGLCDELPAGEAKAHPDELRYLAGVQVAEGTAPPPGMTAWRVAAGRWAVFTHRGSIAKLGETLDWIHRSWSPGPGVSRRAAPELELYDQRFKATAPDSELDIFVPITA